MSQPYHDGLIRFGPFILDSNNAQLRKHDSVIPLTPKAFAVLDFLLSHRGELISKDQLFDAVWPGVVVTEAALTVCIREIRKALSDSSQKPTYIETVYKRGFRFIGSLCQRPAATVNSEVPMLVGRTEALTHLESAFVKALSGQRQLLFITGEAGIGKTSLMDRFIASQQRRADYWLGKGQCIQQHGSGEPYLPLLDALGRLSREHGSVMAELLSRYAPSWLPHLPSLGDTQKNPRVEHQDFPVKAASMLREVTDVLEAMSQQKALILCLEDLHWCDPSTTEFLSYIARRTDPCPILILATLRPAETIVHNRPLRNIKQDLQMRSCAAHLPLEFLGTADIGELISARYVDNDFPDDFMIFLHRQTDGNPLFLVNLLADLQHSGQLVCLEGCWQLRTAPSQLGNYIPNSLQEMIECRIDHLPPKHQHLLEAAAVSGEPGGLSAQFTLAEVAIALVMPVADIEQQMEPLAREEQFIRFLGPTDWANAGVTCRFEFTHALYRNVFYARVASNRKADQHRRLASYFESICANPDGEMINKLAVHYEHSRDFLSASRYLCLSARLAFSRGGCCEALTQLQKGRHLLSKLPESLERDRHELALLQLLAPGITAAFGNASAELEPVFKRALQLCLQLGDDRERFPVLFGLRSFYLIVGKRQKASRLAQQLQELATMLDDEALMLEAHVGQAACHFYQGDLKTSLHHSVLGATLYDPLRHAEHAQKYGLDPGVFCHCRAAQTAWALGYADDALDYVAKGVAIAGTIEHPYSHVFASLNAALIHLYRQESIEALAMVNQAERDATHYDFTFMQAWSYYLQAWTFALGKDEGNARNAISKAVTAPKPEASTTESFLNLFLAECYWYLSDIDNGLAVLKKPCQVHAYSAEHRRLLGEFHRLKMMEPNITSEKTAVAANEAEQCYRQALAISQQQGSKAYSLRSAVGLSKLLLYQQRYQDADDLLCTIQSLIDKQTGREDRLEFERYLKKANRKSNKKTIGTTKWPTHEPTRASIETLFTFD